MTYLGFILHFHIGGGKKLGVNPFREANVNILPRRPNRETQGERTRNTEDRIPDDPPQECVQEEEYEVHDVHDRERERRLIPT